MNTLTQEQIVNLKVQLEVSPPEMDKIFKGLAGMPYIEVSDLINKLLGQANAPAIKAQQEAESQKQMAGISLADLVPSITQ